MGMELKEILNYFKAKDEAELYRLKTDTKEKQKRILSIGRPTPVTLSADECKKLCDKAGVEYLSGYEARVLNYRTTNETKDRYGDIVRAKGADFKNYRNNPVIQYAHRYDMHPIGNTLKIWIDTAAKEVPAWGLFADDRVDTSGMADLTFKMAASGFMRACSIGFMPIETNRPKNDEEAEKAGLGKYGVEFVKWEFLEWSPCSIGANPDALENYFKELKNPKIYTQKDIDVMAKTKFFEDEKLLDMFAELIKDKTGKVFSIPDIKVPEPEKPKCKTCGKAFDKKTDDDNCPECLPTDGSDGTDDVKQYDDITLDDQEAADKAFDCEGLEDVEKEYVEKPLPNEHACRLNPPSKYDKFRRGKRKSDGKVYSIIFGKIKGKDKWEEQAYRYAKKVWTEAQARKHCKDHKGSFEAASDKDLETPVLIDISKHVEVINKVELLGNQLSDLIDKLSVLIDKLPPLEGERTPEGDKKSLYDGEDFDIQSLKLSPVKINP